MDTSRRTTPCATPLVQSPPSPTLPPGAGAPLVAPIRVLSGTQAHRLGLGQGLLVGRDAGCDVVLDDPLASRQHLHIAAGADAVVLEDLRSRNGVFVNGVRVEERIRLCSGDRVLLGTTELSIFPERPHGESIAEGEVLRRFTPISVHRPALEELRDEEGSISLGWVGKYVYYARFLGGLSEQLGAGHLARLEQALSRVPLLAYFADASALSRYDLVARRAFVQLVLANRQKFSSVVMLAWSGSVTAATEAFAAALSGTVTLLWDASEFDRLLIQAAPLAHQRIAPPRPHRQL